LRLIFDGRLWRRIRRRRGCDARRRGFNAQTLSLFQLGVSNYAERQRPRIDRPTCGLFRQRQMLFQTLRQPREKQVARHGVARRQQVERHAFAQRAHENVYLTPVRATQVTQQSFAAALVAAQTRPISSY
jgi:hypothetical protein